MWRHDGQTPRFFIRQYRRLCPGPSSSLPPGKLRSKSCSSKHRWPVTSHGVCYCLCHRLLHFEESCCLQFLHRKVGWNACLNGILVERRHLFHLLQRMVTSDREVERKAGVEMYLYWLNSMLAYFCRQCHQTWFQWAEIRGWTTAWDK